MNNVEMMQSVKNLQQFTYQLVIICLYRKTGTKLVLHFENWCFFSSCLFQFTEPEPPEKIGSFLLEFNKRKRHKKLGMREFNKHEHLKELELYNFLGEDSETGVAKYVVNSAVALEKVKVCCHMLNYKGDGEWSDIYWHTRYYERSRIKIHNKLCGIVRAGTQLTVV